MAKPTLIPSCLSNLISNTFSRRDSLLFSLWCLHRHQGHPAESSQQEWGDAIPVFFFPFALLSCWLFTDQMLASLRGGLTPKLIPAHPASC